MDRRTHKDVIVVGGGLAGLTCAVALGDAGLRVTVLEASADLGGRARSWLHVPSGDEVDIGPHVVHSHYANFLKFLGRLGTIDCIEWQPRKLITLVGSHPGKDDLCHGMLPAPLSLLPSMARASRLPLRDLASNNRATLRALKFGEEDVDELDSLTGLEFLHDCGTTEPMIDWFWRFACMAVLNLPLERVSAASLVRAHSQLIGHRGIHFGFAQVGLSRLYVPQAVAAIRAAGGAVLTRSEVVRCHRRESATLAVVRDGREYTARHLVLALPPQELAAIVPEIVPVPSLEPSPYKSIYLWFDRKLTEERFWALLWSPERVNFDFYDLANIRPTMIGQPSLVASNVIYSHRAESLSEPALVEATIEEIGLLAPVVHGAMLLHADVHHVPMAIPAPIPGFERARPATETLGPGVYLAGDWIRTRLPCSMESAVRSGYLAAEAVLRSEARPTSLAIAPRPNDGLAGLARRVTQRSRAGRDRRATG